MLAQRVFSALIALAVVLGAIFLVEAAVTVIALVAIIALAGWEWTGLFNGRGAVIKLAYAVAIAGTFAAAWWWVPTIATQPQPLMWSALVFWGLAFVTILRFPVRFPPSLVFVVGFVLLVPAFVALAYVVSGPLGDLRLLTLLVVIWAADVGAYFVGRRFGRVRLAPQVSPGKSWEGVAGGLVAAGLVGVVAAEYLGEPQAAFAALAIATAALSIVGDLTISMFKRNAGVKDSGTLFPGHGGLLDRVDSICAGAPLFTLGLSLVGG
ncbi:MAG: phosphatidate cytidylyltransferase [Pseudomonadota bacterium]